MFRSLLAGKSRHRAAMVAGALAGVITPLAAHASLTINLQLATGSAGATQSVKYITPDNTGHDVPVYVYATVTAPTVASTFDAVQYAFYNVHFANVGTSLATALDTATSGMAIDPAATVAYNFDGLGKNESPAVDVYPGNGVGANTNTGSGILAGSTTVTSAANDARSLTTNPIFSTASSNPGYVYTTTAAGNTSVHFLLETLQVKPGTFTASTVGTGSVQNYTKFTATTADVAPNGSAFQSANWNENSTTNTGTGSTASIQNTSTGSYGASTAGVFFEDTLSADATGDGSVGFADLTDVLGHYGLTDTLWADGNLLFPADHSQTTVGFGDLSLVLGTYTNDLTTVTPTVVLGNAALLADPQALALLNSDGFTVAAVPEPMSIGLLGMVGAATLVRRRRVARSV